MINNFQERREHWIILLSALGWLDDVLEDAGCVLTDRVGEAVVILLEAIDEVTPKIRDKEQADGAASAMRALEKRIPQVATGYPLSLFQAQVQRAYQTVSMLNRRLLAANEENDERHMGDSRRELRRPET